MAEQAQIVRLLSPEEVRDLRAKWEEYHMADGKILEADEFDPYGPDRPYIRLIHTLQAAWETIDRLQRG